MDKQKQLVSKIENLDDAYHRKSRELNEKMEAANQEKQIFMQGLDNLAERMRYMFNKRIYNDSQDLRQVYHMIRSTEEEGEWMVKNVLKKLENEEEEQQSAYRKQSLSYEEELTQLKKESYK